LPNIIQYIGDQGNLRVVVLVDRGDLNRAASLLGIGKTRQQGEAGEQ
jgi:hypothetical protein